MVRLAQVPQAGEIELPFLPRADVRGAEGRGEIVIWPRRGKTIWKLGIFMEIPSS